jgi:hypothetical protein
MSWKDLFKSKSVKAKPDPRIRWFGKLPTYADYYSSPADEEWAVEFNDWVLKGFEMFLTRRPPGEHDARLPSAACILRLPKSAMTVFASIQDYGGDMRGRPFPLCFYVGVPSEPWPGPTSDHTVAAFKVLRELTKLREQVVRFFNAPGRFETVFGGRELDLASLDTEITDESWLAEARSLSVADWFDQAGQGLKVDDAQTWLQLVSAWGDTIAKLESEEFGPTLRFPLAMALPFEVQVPGWIRWIERRMDVKQRYLSLLVSKEPNGHTGRLSVVARPVVPEDFLLMTPLAGSLPYVDDVCALAVVQDPDKPSEQPPTSGAFPGCWADFVDASVTA